MLTPKEWSVMLQGFAIIVLVMSLFVLRADLRSLDRKEHEDRQLITELESNYATNADFRELNR